MSFFQSMFSQFFPSAPSFTENDIPAQDGRVFIVTGGNAGIGFELCRMLYDKGATVYMASRSKERADKAIQQLDTARDPVSPKKGKVKFLHFDLNDLTVVKKAAETFAAQESRLDILWNNAGTGAQRVEVGARTVQGFESMIGMHCIATQYFTQLLIPQLRAAVAASPVPGSVRVVWTSSFMSELASPENGIDFNFLDKGTPDLKLNFSTSKAATWMLGREMAHRYGELGIVSVIQNPGNLDTDAYAGNPTAYRWLIQRILYEAKFGAYTELYAGLSPGLTLENNGAYVVPWGKIRPDSDCPRRDLIKAMISIEDGGLGYPAKLWDWFEANSTAYEKGPLHSDRSPNTTFHPEPSLLTYSIKDAPNLSDIMQLPRCGSMEKLITSRMIDIQYEKPTERMLRRAHRRNAYFDLCISIKNLKLKLLRRSPKFKKLPAPCHDFACFLPEESFETPQTHLSSLVEFEDIIPQVNSLFLSRLPLDIRYQIYAFCFADSVQYPWDITWSNYQRPSFNPSPYHRGLWNVFTSAPEVKVSKPDKKTKKKEKSKYLTKERKKQKRLLQDNLNIATTCRQM
ncbi:NAD(P)-binding Rossmann-fold containing protein [Glarea lozoyensis ATCC 20868]|uniref:NAD(P)-binding Rossmann-fold containing protein n=1 Tax=Glarea lozoyensis (strain ATCC 20868 / MF5171) TaxID=1116229 RepID=S3EC71_GLAL2|nr:NAD(P)-binding Rossmann-fold containing protein [Glarea lozoyensis ATCC 20868]EPE35903.1 NAD(P)-binding Rossmann-fold containing protein [Glarea lozoyensis ATCC 20868]